MILPRLPWVLAVAVVALGGCGSRGKGKGAAATPDGGRAGSEAGPSPALDGPALPDAPLPLDGPPSPDVTGVPDGGPPVAGPDAAVAVPVVPPFARQSEFLYTGPDALQTGVAVDALAPHRLAVVRGQVKDAAGAPVGGAVLRVLGHPELGSTRSRADGAFDLAVNGGGILKVTCEKDGFFAVQRTVEVPWQDYALADDIVLTRPDPKANPIRVGMPEVQVAQGSRTTDGAGSRQATLIVPPMMQATMTVGGADRPLTGEIQMRATEYTVGAAGRSALPGELPPTSAYTYAVELSVDQAVAAGASRVTFNAAVAVYVDNFLKFPTGGVVPAAYYDRAAGAWIPSRNGRIVRILAVTGGRADLDVDGMGQAADATKLAALGITDGERAKLAILYQPGQSFWRVPITHFTPWDFNWPAGPPSDGTWPQGQPPSEGQQNGPKPPCNGTGSIIGCEKRTLGETMGVLGTPYTLSYVTDRTPGYLARWTVPASGDTVPASLKRIDVTFSVGGRTMRQSLPAMPKQSATFVWDGLDAYGRVVSGRQPAEAQIDYIYNQIYREPGRVDVSFGTSTGQLLPSPPRPDGEVVLSQVMKTTLGNWDARTVGLGGWTLSAHHAYDPATRTVYYGDGRTRVLGERMMQVSAGGPGGAGEPRDGVLARDARFVWIGGIAIAPDGSVHVSDSGGVVDCCGHHVRRIGRDGRVTTVAGGGGLGYGGDGGPAAQSKLRDPRGIAFAPDGSLYIADAGDHRIRRVLPDGTIQTAVGTGRPYAPLEKLDSDDGMRAVETRAHTPYAVAVGPDGTLFFAEERLNRVRRVGPDGRVTTVAGGFEHNGGARWGSAIKAGLDRPVSLALARDGSLYIAEFTTGNVLKVSTDGNIAVVAERPPRLSSPQPCWMGIAVDRADTLHVACYGVVERLDPDSERRLVSGVRGVAETGIVELGLATKVPLGSPSALAVAPDGTLFVGDNGNQGKLVREVLAPSFRGVAAAEVSIASEAGGEVYVFDAAGRHLRTVALLGGVVRHRFGYDAEGRLSSVTDVDGNTTRILRAADGAPMAVEGPYGQRTTLTLDRNGFLASATDAAGGAVRLAYTTRGLLTSLTDARGSTTRLTYDESGRLIRDEDAAGGAQTLMATETPTEQTVVLKSALGRTTTFRTTWDGDGRARRERMGPNGLRHRSESDADDRSTARPAHGVVQTRTIADDPIFAGHASYDKKRVTSSPGGITRTVEAETTVSIPPGASPFALTTLVSKTTLNGQTSTTTYRAADRSTTIQSATGRTHAFVLDARGHALEIRPGGMPVIRYKHDDRGRITQVALVDAAGQMRVSSATYGASGLVEEVTDALGGRWRFTRDVLGQVTEQIQPDDQRVALAYDPNGNLTSLTPPGRPAHLMTYTALGQLESYSGPAVDPGGSPSVTRFSYNPDRTLASITGPDGQTVRYRYDDAGRLATVALPSEEVTLAYDATGRIARISGPGAVGLALTHDGAITTSETWSGPVPGKLALTYNNDFRLASHSIAGQPPIAVVYDGDGLVTKAGDLALERHPQTGLVVGTTLGKVSTRIGHDGMGDPILIEATFDGQPLYRAMLGRDAASRLISSNETIQGQTARLDYLYDATGQLVGVKRDGMMSAAYAYDGNGNRASLAAGGRMLAGRSDAQDRLVSYGDKSFAHTAAGERAMAAGGGEMTTLGWDAQGVLRSATVGGRKIDYLLDGRQRRVGRVVDGQLAKGWLYLDAARVAAELDGAGRVVASFVYADYAYLPAYMIKGGSAYRLIADAQDNPRLVVDVASGVVVQRMDFDEFGGVTADSNPGFQPFGFRGGLYDPDTRLVHFGMREYDPETGRFVSKDPLLFAAKDPNLYRFANNDPVNGSDPLGLAPGPGQYHGVNVSPGFVTAGITVTGEGDTYLSLGITTNSKPSLTMQGGMVAVSNQGPPSGSTFQGADGPTVGASYKYGGGAVNQSGVAGEWALSTPGGPPFSANASISVNTGRGSNLWDAAYNAFTSPVGALSEHFTQAEADFSSSDGWGPAAMAHVGDARTNLEVQRRWDRMQRERAGKPPCP